MQNNDGKNFRSYFSHKSPGAAIVGGRLRQDNPRRLYALMVNGYLAVPRGQVRPHWDGAALVCCGQRSLSRAAMPTGPETLSQPH